MLQAGKIKHSDLTQYMNKAADPNENLEEKKEEEIKDKVKLLILVTFCVVIKPSPGTVGEYAQIPIESVDFWTAPAHKFSFHPAFHDGTALQSRIDNNNIYTRGL